MQCAKETHFLMWRRRRVRLGVMEFGNCARSPRVLMTYNIYSPGHSYCCINSLESHSYDLRSGVVGEIYAFILRLFNDDGITGEFKASNVLDQHWNFFYKLHLIKAEFLFTYG